MNGWVLLHKKIWENQRFYRKPSALSVWLWLLTHTNSKGIVLCGTKQIGEDLHLSRSTVRDILARFSEKYADDEPIIATKSTNKFSIITILNWSRYQKPYDSKSANDTTTTRQPLATNKEERIKNKEVSTLVDTASYGNKTINEMVGLFEASNGIKLKGQKRQRYAAQRIIKRIGDDARAVGIVKAALKAQEDKFAPTIGDLVSLDTKLNDLASYYRKHKKKEVLRV